MTTWSSGAGDGFLQQLLGDLIGLVSATSPTATNQVDLVRTISRQVASSGQPDSNVDPSQRIRVEDLVRIAAMHVSEVTGLATTTGGPPTELMALPPGLWAWHTADDFRFVLEAMIDEGRPRAPAPGPGDEDEDGPSELISRFMSTMTPMLAAMQLGSAVGHLARTTLGQYEIPIPRRQNRIMLVPDNIDRFAADWGLPAEEVRMWVCIREVTAHAVLSKPHVADRLGTLMSETVKGYARNATSIMERLREVDPSDPGALGELLSNPEVFLTPPLADRRASAGLGAVVCAFLGYLEHVLDTAGSRVLGARGALAEAWRRRQVEREPSSRAIEELLGLDLGPDQIDRGTAFVGGVIERAGERGLAQLWSGPATLPTPAEIEAPGLWLERIDL